MTQSRINKSQEKYLTERGFEVAKSRTYATRHVNTTPEWRKWNDIRQSIICRRSGWAWHAQLLTDYSVLGKAEGLADPIAAYVHAEVSQWGTPQ